MRFEYVVMTTMMMIMIQGKESSLCFCKGAGFVLAFLFCLQLIISNQNMKNFKQLQEDKNTTLHNDSEDNVRRQIMLASQYLSPPFDTLLSDDRSPLFAKVVKNWNETMELVNSKVDVFTQLIFHGVQEKEQLMLGKPETLWTNLTYEGNVCGRAPIVDSLEVISDANSTMVPTLYASGFNENWGVLSSFLPEWRSTNWGSRFRDPNWKDLVTDNPNFIALFTVQHHNFSDPELDGKVLSMPIGNYLGEDILERIKQRPLGLLRDREYDLTVAGSAYRFRIKAFCHFLKSKHFPNPGRAFVKLDEQPFLDVLSVTRYIWTPPGLGYDCYRNWDVLLSGAIPIMERGFGLERTHAFLPTFWIDSYYNLTPAKLADAYPLFVALRNEFDFSRLSKDYWRKLVIDVAFKKSAEVLRLKHPFAKHRVVWPYTSPPDDEDFTVHDWHSGFRVQDCNWTNISSTK